MNRIEIDASRIEHDVVVFEIKEDEKVPPFDDAPKNFWEFVEGGVAIEDILIVCAIARQNGGIREIHHVRRARRDAGPVEFLGSVKTSYSHYRDTLDYQLNVLPTFQALNDLRMTLVYPDEIVVPSFAISSTQGWLLTKEDEIEIQRQGSYPLPWQTA